MDRDALTGILPMALGHDQEASACPWVHLTGRTSEYPSRKAQAALAVANGALPITPDLVDLLFRCDDCGRCRAASILPGPPDLPRALWAVRASLVAGGAVPEIGPLTATLQRFGNLYGDVRKTVAQLGTNEPGAGVLFVPGAATLFSTPDAVFAALNGLRAIESGVDVHPDCLDSGHTLRELGLADQADEVRDRLRRHVVEAGYRLVIAGTPKETFGLREALAGLPIEVRYAGSLIARVALERRSTRPNDRFEGTVVVHPSETLLHRINGFAEIDAWLGSWLGDRYVPEPDPRHKDWPAAIERPAVRTPATLTRALAEHRLAQLQSLAAITFGETSGSAYGNSFIILTCDPFSWGALRAVAPSTVEVVDIFEFAAGFAGEGTRVQ